MIKEIVNQYYAVMQQGISSGKLDFTQLLFADEAVLVGPGEKQVGKKALEVLFSQFTSIIESFEIKRQIIGNSSACTLVEYKTKLSPLKVEMTEWIEIKNGKIVEFRVYYDTVAWEKAIQKGCGIV